MIGTLVSIFVFALLFVAFGLLGRGSEECPGCGACSQRCDACPEENPESFHDT